MYLFCRIGLEENRLDRLHFERGEEITTKPATALRCHSGCIRSNNDQRVDPWVPVRRAGKRAGRLSNRRGDEGLPLQAQDTLQVREMGM
jgi:hypothetical protein